MLLYLFLCLTQNRPQWGRGGNSSATTWSPKIKYEFNLEAHLDARLFKWRERGAEDSKDEIAAVRLNEASTVALGSHPSA